MKKIIIIMVLLSILSMSLVSAYNPSLYERSENNLANSLNQTRFKNVVKYMIQDKSQQFTRSELSECGENCTQYTYANENFQIQNRHQYRFLGLKVIGIEKIEENSQGNVIDTNKNLWQWMHERGWIN